MKKPLKSLFKKLAISIAVSITIGVTLFHFDIQIGSMIEFASPVTIDVDTTITTTITFH